MAPTRRWPAPGTMARTQRRPGAGDCAHLRAPLCTPTWHTFPPHYGASYLIFLDIQIVASVRQHVDHLGCRILLEVLAWTATVSTVYISLQSACSSPFFFTPWDPWGPWAHCASTCLLKAGHPLSHTIRMYHNDLKPDLAGCVNRPSNTQSIPYIASIRVSKLYHHRAQPELELAAHQPSALQKSGS